MNEAMNYQSAPADWDRAKIEDAAAELGIDLSDDHLELVAALQEYYRKVEFPHLRQVKDALEERFHQRGGMRYLYQILPGGPVAQGCQLAGLPVPAGAVDRSFGSVA